MTPYNQYVYGMLVAAKGVHHHARFAKGNHTESQLGLQLFAIHQGKDFKPTPVTAVEAQAV